MPTAGKKTPPLTVERGDDGSVRLVTEVEGHVLVLVEVPWNIVRHVIENGGEA